MDETQPTIDDAAPGNGRVLAVLLSLVVCVGLGAAVALALRSRPAHVPPPPERVGPPAVPVDPGGCGPQDPDRPAVLTLDLEGRVVDFGQVEQGERRVLEVPFRSTGTGPLCIHRVVSGCGCFKGELAEPTRLRYEPGESGVLRITMDATAREGVVQKSVTLVTNQTREGSVVLSCHADVSRGLVLVESAARFRAVPRSTPSEAILTLYTPKDEGPFEVTGVEGTQRAVDGEPTTYTFRVEPVEDPALHKVQLVITHPGRAEPAVYNDALVVHTTHPRRRELTVRSYLQVVDRIRTAVQIVSLGIVGPGRLPSPARVRFLPGIPGLAFRLVEARIVPRAGRTAPASGLGFEASLGRDEAGAWVEVRYDGMPRGPGRLEADLLVLTDDAEQPELRLPVRAEVR